MILVGDSQTLGKEIITGQEGHHVIRTVAGPVYTDVEVANEVRRHCIFPHPSLLMVTHTPARILPSP